MFRVSDVVKHLIIINVLMYFGTLLILGEPNSYALRSEPTLSAWGRMMFALFYPGSEFFQPYQLVTHLFMHADITHLFFNMFALFMFGPPLEATWGPKRFLFYYFATGFGAVVLHMFVRYLELSSGTAEPWLINTPSLGASGAIFGILTGYGMLFPENRVMLIFPPIPMKAKYFVLIFAAIELFMGLGNFDTGIAHYAHLGGALFGFLIILYWRKFGSRL
jgi:membrane associated rhomboid family serine protease